MLKRDLKKDLEIIENATSGEWIEYIRDDKIAIELESGDVTIAEYLEDRDSTFIVAAKEGWKYAIEKAIAAEEQLELALEFLDYWKQLAEEREKEIQKHENELKRIDDALNSWASYKG